MKFSESKLLIILCILANINVLLHLVFYDQLEYHRDELLYFSQGQHPDWGYFSVPPVTGFIAFLVSSLVGTSVLAVKLVPALFSGIMVILGAFTARELGGKSYAMILTAVGLIVAVFMLRAFFLFQPVYMDIFLWSLIFYFLLRYINSKKSQYIYYIGIAAGIGFLNKYLILLLLAAILAIVLFTSLRKIYLKKSFYYSLLLFLIIILPNIIWQINHDLPVIAHMQALQEAHLENVNRKEFLLDQIMMPFMASLLSIPGLIYLFFKKKYRIISLISLFVIAFLFITQGKNYYTLGIYPVLIAAGSVFYEKKLKKTVLMVGLPVAMIILTIPIVPLGIPVFKESKLAGYFAYLEDQVNLTPGRRYEDGSVHPLPQDYADMIGWHELVLVVNKAYQSVNDKEKVAIFCENYGQAGAVKIIGTRFDLPDPISFNESFIYWFPEKFDPEIESFIYVNNKLEKKLNDLFSDIKEVGSIKNPYAREKGTKVFLCTKPKASFNRAWAEITKDLK